MVTFQEQEINVKTEYIIEYIHDPEKWKLVCNDAPAPWELYEKRIYDNLDDAIEFYMIQFFYEKCYDVKMFEDIKLDGKTIRESYIEPGNTFSYTLRKIINNAATAEIDKLRSTVESLEKEIETYSEFIKKYNAEKFFRDFIMDGGK